MASTSAVVDLLGTSYGEPDAHSASAEDARLVAGLQAGCEEDYELFIRRFQGPVYNLALRLVSEPADAGDVVQDSFLKVFRNIHQFRGKSSLRTWVYRIVINEAHNRRRWLFRHAHNEIGWDVSSAVRGRSVADGEPSPFEQTLTHENRALIEQALANINPCFREAVVLRDIEDFDYDEIADILNISIGTVKSRIMRGRDALRQELSGSFGTERLTPCLAGRRA